MRVFTTILLLFSLALSCQSVDDVAEEQLSNSLKAKLTAIRKEISDSLSLPLKIRKTEYVEAVLADGKIALDDYEFDSIDRNHLVGKGLKSYLLDNVDVWNLNFSTLSKEEKENIANDLLIHCEGLSYHMITYLLYHFLDKKYVNIRIEVVNDNVVFLNEKRIKSLDSLKYRLKDVELNSSSKKIKNRVTAIKANKETAKMYTIDKIEDALREVSLLRVNYINKKTNNNE